MYWIKPAGRRLIDIPHTISIRNTLCHRNVGRSIYTALQARARILVADYAIVVEMDDNPRYAEQYGGSCETIAVF